MWHPHWSEIALFLADVDSYLISVRLKLDNKIRTYWFKKIALVFDPSVLV
jgi:hypothetical protein